MHVLAALVTYTCCDFSKGLQYLSPQRVWDNLWLVRDALDAALMQWTQRSSRRTCA